MRRLGIVLAPIALALAGNANADGHSFTLSTGYNETALTSDLRRGTALQGHLARGPWLYAGTLDSRGLASFGVGRTSSADDIDTRTSRYPVATVFARSGEGPGIALDLHQDWYWRGTPSRNPGPHVTMFQTQAGIVFQDQRSPKVRVSHRFVTAARRFPARTQGVEWVWEFRRDYPAVYSPVGTGGEMTPLARRTMRLENWVFFSREVGPAVMRVNVGATYKNVPVDASAQGSAATTLDQASPGAQVKRVPVLMFRLAFEVRRW